jgi:hypothetical protein
MHWSGYEIFSLISGAICLLGAFTAPARPKDRLSLGVSGLFFIGYGIYVARQTSGTYYFPVAIFLLPVVALIWLVLLFVSSGNLPLGRFLSTPAKHWPALFQQARVSRPSRAVRERPDQAQSRGRMPSQVVGVVSACAVLIVGLGAYALLTRHSGAFDHSTRTSTGGDAPPIVDSAQDLGVGSGPSTPTGSSCSMSSPCSATVHTASGDDIRLRQGPGSDRGSNGTVADGGTVTVFCFVSGQTVQGPQETSDRWDRTTGGNYVSDAFLTLGSDSLATCPDAAAPPKTSSGTGDPTLGVVWGPNERGYGTARPSTVFNGGDPLGLIKSITWNSWGGPTADGTGTAEWVGPNQIVADGQDESAQIRAFDLGNCAGATRYRAVEWWFPQHGQTFQGEHTYDLCTPSAGG